MLSGLCRYKFLEQKWFAYKSWFIGIENSVSKSSDKNKGRATSKTPKKIVFQNWRGLGDFGWRGFGVDVLGRRKGLKNPHEIHAGFRTKICTVFCGNPRLNPCRKIKNPRKAPSG